MVYELSDLVDDKPELSKDLKTVGQSSVISSIVGGLDLAWHGFVSMTVAQTYAYLAGIGGIVACATGYFMKKNKRFSKKALGAFTGLAVVVEDAAYYVWDSIITRHYKDPFPVPNWYRNFIPGFNILGSASPLFGVPYFYEVGVGFAGIYLYHTWKEDKKRISQK